MPSPKIKDPVTEHRKQLIKARWEAGESLNQIGRELGVTRNTVLGHVRRMKLPQRTQDAIRQQNRASASKQKTNPKGFALALIGGGGISRDKTRVAPSKSEIAKVDEPKPIGLVENFPDGERNSCRYIHGETTKPGWRLCGMPGYPWCEYHDARFKTPQTGKSNVDPAVLRRSGINRALA